MPTYPKSETWEHTRKSVLRIIAARKISFRVFVCEALTERDYHRAYRNIHTGFQPEPKVEKRIEKWCDKHDPKPKKKAA